MTVKQNRSHRSLYATIFTLEPKTALKARECETGKIYPASDHFGALAVCDEHCVNIHADCGRKLAYCFKQVLNLLVVIAQDHDIAEIGEIRHMDVGSKT